MSDFTFITSHLATGAALTGAEDVAALAAAGVTHVIDCQAERDDTPLFTASPQIAYLWSPTGDDGQPKPVEWFAAALRFALPALALLPPSAAVSPVALRPRVLCHCAAGVNRGPSVAFAVMLALDWPADLAEATIRHARPQVGLAYRADAVRALAALGY